MKPITLSGLHNYLDQIFKDRDPSDLEIKMAKKKYWRAYNSALKRRSRILFPIVQVCFSHQEIEQLKLQLSEGKPLSQFIRQVVLSYLSTDESHPLKVNTAIIEQQLFLISEYLGALLEMEIIDNPTITALASKIESLEQLILKQIDRKK